MIFFKKKVIKFFKKKFIRNLGLVKSVKKKRVLIYYKTEPFVFQNYGIDYSHTNNWEVLEIVRIFLKFQYVVDVIDRDITAKDVDKLSDNYDIFLGLGAGDSGKYFTQIASRLSSAFKIFYAAGPHPDISNMWIHDRYNYFLQRHPDVNIKVRRTIMHVDMKTAMRNSDVIFCIGNNTTFDTYRDEGKSIHRLYPSSSPRIHIDPSSITKKDAKKFLYFGGNGNIVKGLDLLIESFAGLPELELFICAPQSEYDFNEVYKKMLHESKNIHFIGFIDVGGKVFNHLTSECAYVVLPSCSEGTATSVTTCMRRGLIPVVTPEAGIDVGHFGFLIDDISIEGLQKQIQILACLSKKEISDRVIDTYIESFKYTQASFSHSFETALLSVLRETL